MSFPPNLVYTCWASTDNWQLGFVMLGANVYSIPTPPPPVGPIVGIDGLWGAHKWMVYLQPYHHEFLYLSWTPLRPQSHSIMPDILTLPTLTLPTEKTMGELIHTKQTAMSSIQSCLRICPSNGSR
jgi:hypothetical protein